MHETVCLEGLHRPGAHRVLVTATVSYVHSSPGRPAALNATYCICEE